MNGLHGPSTHQTCGHQNVLRRRQATPLLMLKGWILSDKSIRFKTFNKGSLGSRIDEERSEARNVM
jgi:hypothetical protein